MHMHGIDKTNAICAGSHDQGVCPIPFAEKAYASQKSAIRHSASGKDNMAANRQVYFACPLAPSLYQRVMGRLFGQ